MKEWLSHLLVGIIAAWIVGGDLSEPAMHAIGRPPRELSVTNVTFASGNGTLVHGWIAQGEPGKGVVLLLHGVRADRRAMLGRAEFLNALPYTVLLIDLQAHGETRGARITFGDRESQDVTAAIEYLRFQLPNERIGVVGVSLGAAAFVLADKRPPVAAVVLESMYPTIQDAVTNRLRLHVGALGPLFTPLLFMQMRPRLELDPQKLRPIDRVNHIGAPVLILNGTLDRRTTLEEARAIFSAASEPKQFWAVEGAGHVDLHAFAKAEYERRVGEFLAAQLR